MKEFNCTVQLHDKELCLITTSEHSILSFEKKVDSYRIEAYLIWKTEKDNQDKYLISTRDLCDYSKNLEGINLRYSNAKEKHIDNVTLCFINPPHNLVIQSTDNTSLNTFVKLVSMMSVGRWYSVYKLSSDRKSNSTLRNIKINGRKRKYPPKKGFPRTTEELILKKKNIRKFDPQIILYLHNLQILDLSNNQILYLPKELGSLPHLEKLFLSHNCLGNTCSEISKWEWMEQTAISQSLKELNISNNNLTELPLQIGKLQNLLCLNVSQNLITKLPQIIGTLQQLAMLDLSTNLLSYLPGSMRGMELDYLVATNNPFTLSLGNNKEYLPENNNVASLFDLAAKTVKKHRIPYNNLPSDWAKYLDNSKFCCICRDPCFYSDITFFRSFVLNQYLKLGSIPLTGACQSMTIHKPILYKCYCCSSKCFFYFLKRYKTSLDRCCSRLD